MYCSKCGNQIADNSAFCPYCGAQAQKPYVNPNQNGSITFYREKSWVAANSAAKIKIDGKTYCELNVNEHFTASLPYGSYNVEIKIALKPTETFFVTVSPENPNPYFSFKYDFVVVF